MIVRKATGEDWERISEISRISGYNDYINNIGKSYLDDGIVIVAEEGVVMGFSKAEFSPDNSSWLGGLRVDPEFRRRGIAMELTNKLVEYSRDSGCRFSRLLIEDGNTKSINLAEKAGFNRVRSFSFFKGSLVNDGYSVTGPPSGTYLNLGWNFSYSDDFVPDKHGIFYRKGKNLFFRSEERNFYQVIEADSPFESCDDEGMTIVESGRGHRKFIDLEPLEDFRQGHLYEKRLVQ